MYVSPWIILNDDEPMDFDLERRHIDSSCL